LRQRGTPHPRPADHLRGGAHRRPLPDPRGHRAPAGLLRPRGDPRRHRLDAARAPRGLRPARRLPRHAAAAARQGPARHPARPDPLVRQATTVPTITITSPELPPRRRRAIAVRLTRWLTGQGVTPSHAVVRFVTEE